MCRIWENKKSDDISVENLRKGLANGLFSEVSAIGFNGGEPTLRKDLPELVQVCLDSLPNLRSVSLITNAYNYRDVINQVEKVGQLVKNSGKHFDLMVSLDGFGDVHDRVRGRPGNFDRALHVIDYAKDSPVVDNLRIGCTVIRENVFYLADLLDFCIEHGIYVKYRQGVPHQRLYTETLAEPYALTFEEKYEFVEFLEGLIKNYEPGFLQKHFYRSLIDQIIREAPRKAGCDWQHRGATITSKGELAYCAVKSKVLMPDIATGDSEHAYFNNKPHLEKIIKDECDNCHHDYVGLPGRSDYLRVLLSKLDERFNLKNRIKRLPGFRLAKRIYAKGKFNSLYQKYNNVPRAIPITSVGSDSANTKVMICGWYGTETLGDKAIIGGIINTIKASFKEDVDIAVVSLFPYVTEMTKRQMTEFESVNVVGVEDGLKMVSNFDMAHVWWRAFNGNRRLSTHAGPVRASKASRGIHYCCFSRCWSLGLSLAE